MIADALQEIRERRKLTAKEVASAVGVSQRIYYNWESGITSVPIEYIMPISKALNVSVDYLLNYGKMSLEEYTDKYNVVAGVISAIQRNEVNKDYLLWLFNNSDIDVEGLILISTAYAVIEPRMRRHLSASVWAVFRDAFRSGHIQDDVIAKKLYESETTFLKIWNDLNESEKEKNQ